MSVEMNESDESVQTGDSGSAIAEDQTTQLTPDSEKHKKPRTRRRCCRAFIRFLGWFMFFILLAIPAAILIEHRFETQEQQLVRQQMVDYLVFSYTLHLRSYWTMNFVDNALEAGANDGDYGVTTKFYPVFVRRADGQVSAAQEEIRDFSGTIPPEARDSYNEMRKYFNEMEDLVSSLQSVQLAVPYGDLLADSVIVSWGGRQALRQRFDISQGTLRGIRQDAVTAGYDWVYEDLRLKALYQIDLDLGQTMFQSNSF